MNRRPDTEDETKARLAAALRENLKRRKAQARSRKVEETSSPDEMRQPQAETSRS